MDLRNISWFLPGTVVYPCFWKCWCHREGAGGSHERPPATGKFSKTVSKTGPSDAFWANCKGSRWTTDFSFVYCIKTSERILNLFWTYFASLYTVGSLWYRLKTLHYMEMEHWFIHFQVEILCRSICRWQKKTILNSWMSQKVLMSWQQLDWQNFFSIQCILRCNLFWTALLFL